MDDVDASLHILLTLTTEVVNLVVGWCIVLNSIDGGIGTDNFEFVDVALCTCDGDTDDVVSLSE